MKIILTACVFIFVINAVCGAKILCVFTMASYSHHIIGHRLLEALAEKGHDVTMVSPFQNEKPITNYRNIALTGMKEMFEAQFKSSSSSSKANSMNFIRSKPSIIMQYFINNMAYKATEYTFNHTNFKKLLAENNKYDLIILQQFVNDALKGLCYHFNAPCILLTSASSGQVVNYIFGNTLNPSYVSQVIFPYNPSMNIWQRLNNALHTFLTDIMNELIFFNWQDSLLHKYFPSSPPVRDLIYNQSLILLNSHPSVTQSVPKTPNIIEVAGMHVLPPKELPKDLKKYLDDAKDGAILFSLGSNLKSADLPDDKRNDILKTFSKLKQRVLWKFEEELTGLPDNVKINKWLPQPDVLAHPNIIAFITHGGLLSTIEAVHRGVPLIGIPFGADQKGNIAMNAYNGFAIYLDFDELNENSLTIALNEILKNKTYTVNAKQRSRFMNDQPLKPLQHAVYWCEFIIRHKGAPHMRSASLDLPWYKLYLLDILLLAGIIAFISIAIPVFIIYFICVSRRERNIKFVNQTNRSKDKNKKNK